MTIAYSILAPLAGLLSMSFALVSDYHTATLLLALSGAAAVAAIVRNGQ